MLRILFIPLTVNSWFKNKQTNQPQKNKQTLSACVIARCKWRHEREIHRLWNHCKQAALKTAVFPPFCFLWSKTGLIALVHDPFHPRALNRRWHTQMNNPRSCRKSTVQSPRANTELRFGRRNQSRGCLSVVAFIDAFREYRCTSAGLLLPKLRLLYTYSA